MVDYSNNIYIMMIAGNAKNFSSLLGNNENTTLGKNSATRRTINDETATCVNKIKNGIDGKN